MRNKAINAIYSVIIFFILAFSAILVFTIRKMTISKVNADFFFLGAGLMLLEIGDITKLSLLFGSTWVVNSIVISAVLCAVLSANIVVDKLDWGRSYISYLLLFSSLSLAYLCYKYSDLLSFGNHPKLKQQSNKTFFYGCITMLKTGTILAKLYEHILPEAKNIKVADLRIGLGYVGVRLDNGSAGIAAVLFDALPHGCTVMPTAGSFAGSPAQDLLKFLVEGKNPLEIALGLACANALIKPPEIPVMIRKRQLILI